MQNIEAEDHILGPLTLRQFIFALIAVFFFYLSFITVTKLSPFLLIIFLPPALFFGFFAIPFGRDQPTEVWALAKIRFWLKPRKRIWDQSGVKELVTISVPKKIERVLTNGLSQYEVDSRLKALASTLDSRGWAVKNVALSAEGQNYMPNMTTVDSERLIDMSTLPQSVPDDNLPADADILDDETSPLAQHFGQMIDESSNMRHQQLVQKMNASVPSPQIPSSQGNNQWFMPKNDNNSNASNVSAPDVLAQNETPEETAIAAQLKSQHKSQQVSYGNLRTLQPLGSQPIMQPVDNYQPVQQTDAPIPTALTVQPDPAIISLANNDDISVATIAREAKKVNDKKLEDNDEVVISLH